jgi:hypothetical protein
MSGMTSVARGNRYTPMRIFVLGMSLGIFLVASFVICVVFDLLFPAYAMNPAWKPLLPGFEWISWPSFFLGSAEAFVYGWYTALVFGPIYNALSRRVSGTPSEESL